MKGQSDICHHNDKIIHQENSACTHHLGEPRQMSAVQLPTLRKFDIQTIKIDIKNLK